MIEGGLVAMLLADTEMKAQVAGRVYHIKAPQNPTLPYLTVLRVSGERDIDFDGPDALIRSRVQIDAWAGDPKAARDLADLLRRELNDYRGPAGRNGDIIHFMTLITDEDLYEDDPKLFRISQDWYIHCEEV